MKNIISILILLVAVGCGKSEVETKTETKTERIFDGDQPPLDLPLVGSYERKTEKNTNKLVFLENGKFEAWQNGKKEKEGTWKISGKEVQTLVGHGENAWFRIEPNGDLILIAFIKDGKRTDYPKELKLTWKKLKE